MSRKTIKRLTLLVAVVLALGACDGDDSGSTADDASGARSSPPGAGAGEYMSVLCTEMSDWLTQLQELQAQIQISVEPGADPTEAQDALRTFFDNAITATDQLIGAIHEVGTPAVQGGNSIHEEVLKKFEDVNATLEEARSKVDTLPIEDRQEFVEKTAELRESVQSQLAAIGAALATLSQPDLDAAAAEVQACTGLKPTGG